MQVFAWGCGSCLGCGSSETTSLRPRFVEDLSITKIIDISCGDSHCLALSHGKRPSTVPSHDCPQGQCRNSTTFVSSVLNFVRTEILSVVVITVHQRMKCMPGGTTPWASVDKATHPRQSLDLRRFSAWRGCQSNKSLLALLTVWLGLQSQLTGEYKC